jgi:predicted DsbA family dithiol-disulfide isomerase
LESDFDLPLALLPGIDRRAYYMAKFGSWERALELDARVAVVGERSGTEFAIDRVARVPNTFDAYRLDLIRPRPGPRSGRSGKRRMPPSQELTAW